MRESERILKAVCKEQEEEINRLYRELYLLISSGTNTWELIDSTLSGGEYRARYQDNAGKQFTTSRKGGVETHTLIY